MPCGPTGRGCNEASRSSLRVASPAPRCVATALYFGQVPGRQGRILSVVSLLAAAWLILSIGFGIPINEKEWWPFYTKCAELDVPVIFQVGHSAEFMPSACGKPILLDDIAIWFPELRLIGGHTGARHADYK